MAMLIKFMLSLNRNLLPAKGSEDIPDNGNASARLVKNPFPITLESLTDQFIRVLLL
jgi:hypothetical protein